MSVTLNVILGITLIFLGTTLGSSLIFFFKNKGEISPKINQITLGFASGIMLSASIFSLIVPAYNYNTGYMPSYLVVSLGIIIGAIPLPKVTSSINIPFFFNNLGLCVSLYPSAIAK